jgi:hypothetical protein
MLYLGFVHKDLCVHIVDKCDINLNNRMSVNIKILLK